MRRCLEWLLPIIMTLSLPAEALAEWEPVEIVESYRVTGRSGAALYRSIGENGPKLGGLTRTIAYTNFKLTWTRKYERQGQACAITTAKPRLIVTYRLPKPAERLPPATRASWDRFIAGVHAHEKIHGEMIIDMVRQIRAVSLGLKVEDDPACRRIREVLTARLGELSRQQRQKSRDFDRDEMSAGGNIHRLVLDLVNGP